ncbi:TPA: acetylornithine transaminase [Streptococcus suis]|uniref:Acetylornithine aminotransferase n=1 Tax=Streptococcus suis TaxID=1307 RepID=A0A9X4MLE9_STRSU|nr:acetylornithine transaminase [Streptococcus parasuis]MDG4512462.1 acetylornithine transaminase [Streptococcus suis]MDG4524593.1 acetylornithine transaminase [Streptococcus suis]QWV86423.1 acetylornithine transaminase [Streptococcus parasuis]ULL21306.1 acetylornithine transaminase [Streptococcus suis]WDN57919.1 acetylornithine transaminase [Streptococcus parasuis]
MTKLFQNYKRESIEFIKAADNYLVDKEGNFYLDFSSGIGVTNLGFHKQVKQAVSEQLEAIWHSPNLYQNSLQEKVADLLIGDEDYLAFFCNSGAESNEAAIKLARKFSGKSDIITFKQSFHGRTFGAMSATGQEKIQLGFGPLVEGFHYAIYNDLESVKQLVTENTAAVMLELVQGEGGVIPAEKDFVAELAHYCKEQGLLLIVDEVQTGIGRTGTLFAYQQYGISPDIITLAKGLANGLPVGAMLGKSALGTAFTYGSHGTTFGGNKLVLSSSKAVLEILTEDFLAKVRVKASYLQDQLAKQLGNLPTVVAIRGLGLMLGIQVTGDLGTIVTQARKNGLIVLTAGSDVIRLLPPLTITEEEIERAVSILAECLS